MVARGVPVPSRANSHYSPILQSRQYIALAPTYSSSGIGTPTPGKDTLRHRERVRPGVSGEVAPGGEVNGVVTWIGSGLCSKGCYDRFMGQKPRGDGSSGAGRRRGEAPR